MINWTISKQEMLLIGQIVDRACALFAQVQPGATEAETIEFRRTTLMDLHACHANGCPLRLEGLLTAPRFEFLHDVFGIRGHIDRQTGQLEDCFVPRFARNQVTA